MRLVDLGRRLKFLLHRRRNLQDIEEEMRLHLELHAGDSSSPAHARRRFGNRTSLHESSAEVWAFTSVEQLWRDVIFATRTLRRNPVFALAAITSLSLGIGANTAVFSLVNTLVFRPLPVHDPRQLVHIGSLENNGLTMPLPGPVLDHLRKDPLLQGVCGFTAGDAPIAFANHSAVVASLSLTGDCYRTLGVHPALGRLLEPSDDNFNGPKVAVLGYSFWKSSFAGNPNVLGSTIEISGVPFQIVGVTEPRFEGLLWGYLASVSAPISQRTSATAQDPSARFYWAETLGRLRNGARRQNLQAQLRTNWRRLLDAALPPGFNGVHRSEIVNMPPIVTSGATGLDPYFRAHFQKALFALLAISLLVLLVSCLNVANLLLARGLHCQHEIGIRLAIGAARWRIVRQLFAESVLLLAASLGIGFILAVTGAKTAAAFFLAALARSDTSFTVAIDWRVLLFTSCIAILAVLLFALLPAWQTSHVDPAISIKSSSPSVTGSPARARKVLLATQLAMTLVILVGANVFAQSIRHLRDNALNLDGDTVLDAQLMPVPQAGQNPNSYLPTLLHRVRALNGVKGVSLSSFAPLMTSPYQEDVRRLDRPDRHVLQAPAEFVTGGFLQIMHMPLLSGRDFGEADARLAQRFAILSQSAAERLFPEGHALGRHIQFGSEPETRNVEVIGIAADRPLEDPHLRNGNFLLLNLWQLPRMAYWGNLQVEFSGPSASVAASLRNEIQKLGRQQIFLLHTMIQLREQSLLQDRLLAAIGQIYVALVLVLAALGLIGLLLFFVSSREKEIAMRMAPGSSQREIRSLVVKEAALLTGIGMLLGLPLSYAVIHGFSSVVYGVSPTLIGPVSSSLATLSALALLALLVPLYRAGSINPNAVLRDH